MCVMKEDQKESGDDDACDEEGISELMEEAGRRVKVEHLQIGERLQKGEPIEDQGQFCI